MDPDLPFFFFAWFGEIFVGADDCVVETMVAGLLAETKIAWFAHFVDEIRGVSPVWGPKMGRFWPTALVERGEGGGISATKWGNGVISSTGNAESMV